MQRAGINHQIFPEKPNCLSIVLGLASHCTEVEIKGRQMGFLLDIFRRRGALALLLVVSYYWFLQNKVVL